MFLYCETVQGGGKFTMPYFYLLCLISLLNIGNNNVDVFKIIKSTLMQMIEV